jgi:hypothetical protein
MAERKILDERHKISGKRGNGQLRRELWEDEQGNITRYNLSYINFRLCQRDNGRVLGYDNNYGYHHRHFMGNRSAIEFKTYEQLEALFEHEWTLIHQGR